MGTSLCYKWLCSAAEGFQIGSGGPDSVELNVVKLEAVSYLSSSLVGALPLRQEARSFTSYIKRNLEINLL